MHEYHLSRVVALVAFAFMLVYLEDTSRTNHD
jgi:hypothetical protein